MKKINFILIFMFFINILYTVEFLTPIDSGKVGSIGEEMEDELWTSYDIDGKPDKLIEDDERFVIKKELIYTIMEEFPEGFNQSSRVDEANLATNILIEEDETEIWVTFVFSQGDYNNTLAYYTYPRGATPTEIGKATLIFPNGKDINKGGILKQGDTVYLGKFSRDTVIGWLLLSDGWKNNTVDSNAVKLYSNKEFHNGKQQMLVFEYLEDREQTLILAFEDMKRPSGDSDFNDLMFYVSSNKWLIAEDGDFIKDIEVPLYPKLQIEIKDYTGLVKELNTGEFIGGTPFNEVFDSDLELLRRGIARINLKSTMAEGGLSSLWYDFLKVEDENPSWKLIDQYRNTNLSSLKQGHLYAVRKGQEKGEVLHSETIFFDRTSNKGGASDVDNQNKDYVILRGYIVPEESGEFTFGVKTNGPIEGTLDYEIFVERVNQGSHNQVENTDNKILLEKGVPYLLYVKWTEPNNPVKEIFQMFYLDNDESSKKDWKKVPFEWFYPLGVYSGIGNTNYENSFDIQFPSEDGTYYLALKSENDGRYRILMDDREDRIFVTEGIIGAFTLDRRPRIRYTISDNENSTVYYYDSYNNKPFEYGEVFERSFTEPILLIGDSHISFDLGEELLDEEREINLDYRFVKSNSYTIYPSLDDLSWIEVASTNSVVEFIQDDGLYYVLVAKREKIDGVDYYTRSKLGLFEVDRTPPEAPVIIEPQDGSYINMNNPIFKGRAEAESVVRLYNKVYAGEEGVIFLGVGAVDEEGYWEVSLEEPLIDGLYQIFAKATDKAKNESEKSTNINIVIDTIPPEVILAKIKKVEEGKNKNILSRFFENGVIDPYSYKPGDKVEIIIKGSDTNIQGYKVSLDGLSYESLLNTEEFSIKIPITLIDEYENKNINYTIKDKAGNETIGFLNLIYSRTSADKVEVETSIFSNEGLKFVGKEISLRSGPNVSFVIGTGSKTDRYYGIANPNYLRDLKDGNVSFHLTNQGEQDLLLYSFTLAGNMTVNNEILVVDRDINFDGILRSLAHYNSNQKYSVKLNFEAVTEYVGLSSFRIINSDGITGDTSGNLTPSNPNSKVLVSSTYLENPIINFAHKLPTDKVLNIELQDSLGNTRVMEYRVGVQSRIELFGRTSGDSREIKSTIDISNMGELEIRRQP